VDKTQVLNVLHEQPAYYWKRAINLVGLVSINLRKDCATQVFWTLTLSFQDGRVEVFDSVSHASEEELRKAFNFVADTCNS